MEEEMTMEVQSDLVTSLGVIRGNVVHHLAGVSRYRALRNVEQTITDIAEYQELVTPLRDVREQIALQLEETREYRALRTIDGIIPQLVDVLAFLDEKSNFKLASSDAAVGVAEETEAETPSDTQLRTVYTRADETASAEDSVAFADTASEPQRDPASQEDGAAEHSAVQHEVIPESSDPAVGRDDGAEDEVDLPPNPDTAVGDQPAVSMSDASPSAPVALLVQSVKPSTQDETETLSDSEADLAAAVKPDHVEREDKAA